LTKLTFSGKNGRRKLLLVVIEREKRRKILPDKKRVLLPMIAAWCIVYWPRARAQMSSLVGRPNCCLAGRLIGQYICRRRRTAAAGRRFLTVGWLQ